MNSFRTKDLISTNHMNFLWIRIACFIGILEEFYLNLMGSFFCVALFHRSPVFSLHSIQTFSIMFQSFFYSSIISIIARSKEAILLSQKMCRDFFSSFCKKKKKLQNNYIYAGVFFFGGTYIRCFQSLASSHLIYRSRSV